MDEAQTKQVADGLRVGDPLAWRKLYDAYAEQVWRWVARWIGPHPADVADIVQEAMLAAARSARGFDASKGSLRQWLWGIARTQVQLHFRKKQQHDRWKQFRKTEAVVSPSEDDAEHVRFALAELPGDYDALLTAKYLDGEAVETIAHREGTTVTAVRSKLARAREAFRQVYERLQTKAGARP